MTTATATKPTPVTWTEGVPPLPEKTDATSKDVYLLDGPEWDCPALVHWSWNARQEKWYLYFHDTAIDDVVGPVLSSEEVKEPHERYGYQYIYLFDANER
jgi:hypothetical protein